LTGTVTALPTERRTCRLPAGAPFRPGVVRSPFRPGRSCRRSRPRCLAR
jgi:hypothetical protein